MKGCGFISSSAALLLILSLASIRSLAQDAQFSQQTYAPLFLNPALAGGAYDKQALLIHREQHVAGADPFRTTAASFEFCLNPITPERTRQSGRLGLGFGILNDRSGTPAFRTTDIQVDLAYQLFIDGFSSISAGIQTGLRQQAIDPLQGSWASQYNGQQYDAALPHGETFQSEIRTRPDVGAGLVYSFKRMPQPRKHSSTLELRAGAAIFHAARPDLSVLEGQPYRLDRRLATFVEGAIGLGGGNLELRPAAYLHMQGMHSQLLAGIKVRKEFGGKGGFLAPENNPALSLGLFSRNGQAMVATLEVEWGEYAIGIGYDMNLTGVVQQIAPMNAIEFGIRYRIAAATGPRRAPAG